MGPFFPHKLDRVFLSQFEIGLVPLAQLGLVPILIEIGILKNSIGIGILILENPILIGTVISKTQFRLEQEFQFSKTPILILISKTQFRLEQ